MDIENPLSEGSIYCFRRVSRICSYSSLEISPLAYLSWAKIKAGFPGLPDPVGLVPVTDLTRSITAPITPTQNRAIGRKPIPQPLQILCQPQCIPSQLPNLDVQVVIYTTPVPYIISLFRSHVNSGKYYHALGLVDMSVAP